MPLGGDYVPSSSQWVADQVARHERSNGREADTQLGVPIIVVMCRGASSGNIRKFAQMRVVHSGEYALVASNGGAEQHPAWFHNLVAEPLVEIHDGPEPQDHRTEIVTGDERREWWERCVSVFPKHAEDEADTDREIPVFVARPL